jgi:hypothetical protein
LILVLQVVTEEAAAALEATQVYDEPPKTPAKKKKVVLFTNISGDRTLLIEFDDEFNYCTSSSPFSQ